MRTTFVAVPIQVGVGYEFNALLREVSTRSAGGRSLAEAKERQQSIAALVDDALAGRHGGAAQTDEARRLAGALLVFAVADAPAPADNVVPIAEAASLTEDRSRVDDARRDAEHARADLRRVRADLEQARGETDLARQAAGEAKHELASARRDADAAQQALLQARAQLEEARAAGEAARIRMEEAAHDRARMRAELLETREQARATVARLEQELAAARADADRLAREVAELERARPAREPSEPPAGALSPAAVERAIEDDLFVLHSQPVLDLHDDRVAQHELLLRMACDDGRLLLPQAFLAPARRAGLAGAIDRWVVRRAVALLADGVPADQSVEVNLSPEAIHDDGIVEAVEQELAATMVDPARLILEITSQTAAEDLQSAQTLARRLRSLGCRFALDDFRSTFGSLRLLKDIPLDYLKLDGDLVSSLAESRTSQLITRAIVDVARATGTRTVAVFVSDERTLEQLREHGVDYAQGYSVGRPSAVEKLRS